jgi:O-antigen biosynthesis protein
MKVITPENIQNRFHKPAHYFAGKRPELLTLIPSQSKTILDVGCGSAEVWKDFPAEVSGVEINPIAAERARKILKQVVSGDVEKEPLPFQENSFDCILFADVLEHLYDPWGMLLDFKKYLKTNGNILISVPNIRHYRVMRALLFTGEFPYEESGILDIDHTRFFTLKEVKRMLESTGFEIVKCQLKISASSKYKLLNTLCFGLLKDFLAEQYYILARPRS